MRSFIKVSAWLIVFVIFAVGITNFWVILSTRDYIFYDSSKVPVKKVALILGTSKKTVEGEANKYFQERIKTAASLFFSGKVKHLIVSGDNETIYYNEPRDMYAALVALGVPDSNITLDYAGFRTLDSIVRAKVVFGQEDVLIITQDFHCYRALFIARHYDIDALAFSADQRDELPAVLAFREIIARSKTVIDLFITNEEPRFLGGEERFIID